MPRFSRSQKGFSLLELLVVISIMGIIMAMLAVSFGTAQQKGRDSKRRADIKSMQTAFEQYYSENNAYSDCNTMGAAMFVGGVSPTDPQTGQNYSCQSDVAAYCVCALLEDEGKGNATSDATGTACSYGTTNANYICSSNQQ